MAAEVKLPFSANVRLRFLWEISMRHWRALLSSALLFVYVTAVGSRAALAAPSYELAMTTPGGSGALTVYRINVASGEVANVSEIPSTNIVDPQPVPAANYRLFVATQSNGTTYWLYRLETESGRTWFLSGGAWKEVTAK
jgi:hypothetical protein